MGEHRLEFGSSLLGGGRGCLSWSLGLLIFTSEIVVDLHEIDSHWSEDRSKFLSKTHETMSAEWATVTVVRTTVMSAVWATVVSTEASSSMASLLNEIELLVWVLFGLVALFTEVEVWAFIALVAVSFDWGHTATIAGNVPVDGFTVFTTSALWSLALEFTELVFQVTKLVLQLFSLILQEEFAGLVADLLIEKLGFLFPGQVLISEGLLHLEFGDSELEHRKFDVVLLIFESEDFTLKSLNFLLATFLLIGLGLHLSAELILSLGSEFLVWSRAS